MGLVLRRVPRPCASPTFATHGRLLPQVDQVNLKSELMLQELHDKIDELRNTEMPHIQTTMQGIASLESRINAVEQLLKTSKKP